MKQIIYLSLILGVINSVAGIVDKEKWVSNAKDFAAEAMKSIVNTDYQIFFYCSEIRAHVVELSSRRLFNAFNSCDSDKRNFYCYKKNEHIFHQDITDARNVAACMNDFCSFWISKKNIVYGQGKQCFHVASWDILIDIWSRCSIMAPVFDFQRRVLNTKNHMNVNCIKLAQHTVQDALRSHQKCKKKIFQELNIIKIGNPDRNCLERNLAMEIYFLVAACDEKHLNNFEKLSKALEKRNEHCEILDQHANRTISNIQKYKDESIIH